MKIICDQWRQIAHKANLAGWLLHHFRKGGVAGDADAFRGSTAIQNSARVMETMTTMTKDEASELGMDEFGTAWLRAGRERQGQSHCGIRGQVVSLQSSATRESDDQVSQRATSSASWFRGSQKQTRLSWAKVDGALNQISIGVGDSFYSTSPNTGDRWAGKVIMAWTSCNRKKAKEHLGSWLASGILFTEEVKTKARNRQEVLRVDLDAKARLQQDMTGEK